MQGGDLGSMGGDELQLAVSRALTEGQSMLVIVESEDGLADSALESLPEQAPPVLRACAAETTRGAVGGVADALDLDHVDGPAVITVDNAQWADPTSMGRLQRLISGVPGVVAVVSHTPATGDELWWLDSLARTAAEKAAVVHTTANHASTPTVETPSDESALDLVLATKLVGVPISVPVAARFLSTTESEVLKVAETLVGQDLLVETRTGFTGTPAGRSIRTGEARVGYAAQRLATAFAENDGDPAVVGALHLMCENFEAAYPSLRTAALNAEANGAPGEAHQLSLAALEAAEAGSVGAPEELGHLHLISGRHLRAVGRSEAAAGHLESAVGLLEGPDRIDALAFAAAVADDRQHPQDAETILATAEWEAATQDQLAKLGFLGTFRARALNRIGFAAEADASLSKAEKLLEEHATATQEFFAHVNRAWILFDRGQATMAEAEFTRLRDHTEPHDLAGLADKEAWRARALFASGHPGEAMEAVEKTFSHSYDAGVEAPVFLAELGLVEGNLAYGRPAEALEASERVLDLVARVLPAWDNVARGNRALALARLGRADEAAAEVAAALASTPSGANGWRLRSRLRAIQIEVETAQGNTFPRTEAEDLADLFLETEHYGWAADLLCVVAESTSDQEVAREAMALATQIGNPMVAARAAEAGKLWADPGAAPAIRALRSMETRLPAGWDEQWRQVPAVAAALSAPEPVGDTAGAEENAATLEESLRRVGLSSADTILSPAQRRQVRQPRSARRRRGPWVAIAAALGVVALAAATAAVVGSMNEPEPPPQAEATTVPAPASLEETAIAAPAEQLFGVSVDRGDMGRSGFVAVAGPRTVDGYYWIYNAADAIVATPLSYGNNLLVGAADGTFQAVDLSTGRSVWSMTSEDQIATSGTLGTASFGEGQSAGLVVLGADDGIVRARDAVTVEESQAWSERLGSRIRSSPVADETTAYVATTDGFVHALDLASGDVMWTYPSSDASLGPITAGLALADGIIYVGTENGELHLINTDGTPVCQADLDGSILVNPVVTEGRAYISLGNVIRILPAGVCEVPVSNSVQYLSETVVDVAPAVVGDLMYVPNGIFLNAISRSAVEEGVSDPVDVHHWSPGQVQTEGKIASPPVVTPDAVYFGTQSGHVYAVDADTGEPLWHWKTGNYVRASPVVIDGAVYIASGDGRVYAVGPAS